MAGVNEQTPPEGQPEGQPSEPVPGSPEYDAAMADKYTSSQSPASEEEPATPADGAAEGEPEGDPKEAGLKIEKQEEASEDEPKEGEEQSEGETEGEGEEETPPALSEELFQSASNEFAETGELTDETIESLTKAGIPRDFIDTYVAGARALKSELTREAHGLVGGEDNWNAMMEWAKTLPEADIEAFNESVTNPKTSKLAIQGLYSRYATENGSEAPSAAAGAERGVVGSDVYGSKADMTADMRDPRYAKDASFRQQVEAKIARSRKAGTLGPLGTAY